MPLSQAELEELEFLELQMLVNQAQGQPESAPAPEPAPAPVPEKAPLDTLNSIRGGVQSVVQGQTLNWGDEIVGAGRALADRAIGALTGNEAAVEAMTGQAAEGIRARDAQMYADDERANMAQFRQENPKTAFGLELAGGFASPVNFVAPGAGGLAKSAKATQRLRAGAGRGIIEGAIAGAGNADENRAAGALTGAALGGILPVGINVAIKEPWRQLTKRRIVQDLFEEGRDEFGKLVRKFKTPIHMSGEHSTLVDLYRQVVGRAWGGKQVLGAQEAPLIEAAEEGLQKAQYKAKVLGRTLAQQTDEVKKSASRAAADIDDQYARDTARITREIEEATARGDVEKIAKLEAVQEMSDAALEKEAMDLRGLAATEAMPDNARMDIINGVDGDDLLDGPIDVNDPLAVNNRLIDWWRKRGFSMVKDREFEWDQGLGKSVAREFSEDPGLALVLDDAPGLVAAMEKRLGMSDALEALKGGDVTEEGLRLFQDFFSNPNLKINGDALMEMRNAFAKAANRGGDKSFAFRRIKEKFDSLIRRQLDGSDVEAFDDQLARWTKRLTYEEATAAANQARGAFSPEQYANAAKKVAGKEAAARGATPLYDDYNTALERQAAVKATTKQASAQAKEEASGLSKSLAAEKEARLNAADSRRRLEKARAEADQAAQLDALDAPRQRDDAAKTLSEAKANARAVAARGIPKKASGLSSLLTTLLLSGGGAGLGGAIGGPLGAAVGLGVGSSVARGLGQEGAQLALAGQLRSQETLRKVLELLNNNAVTPAIQRTLNRELIVDTNTEG